MSDMGIGISGMSVAQKAIEVIGNNIANASTDGYHRQEIRTVPIDSTIPGRVQPGGGAEVIEIRRIQDQFIDRELQHQQSPLGQADQELTVLQSLENTLGALNTQGLSQSINDFYSALKEVASQPGSQALRDQAVWTADAMTSQFRNTAGAIDRLVSNVTQSAADMVTQINAKTAEIAQLNDQIRQLGASNVNLLDRRDQTVTELAQLGDVQTVRGDQGTISVYLWGTQVVTSGTATPITVGKSSDGQWGYTVTGGDIYDTAPQGGRLAGLLALENDLLPGIRGQLDDLAGAIIRQVNTVHAQGIGLAGSFTALSGSSADTTAKLADWDPPIAAGDIYVRVTDTQSNVSTVSKVTVDPATETLADVANALAGVSGLGGTGVADGRLHIVADPGHTFDFLPTVPAEPATASVHGTATPSVSGFYTGQDNQVLTATVSGTGDVGSTADLVLNVTNEAGENVARVNVGQGYAAGDTLDLGNGIQVAFSRGTVEDGDTFTINAVARTDTSGLLAAAGINTLFQGTDAGTIDVVDAVRQSSDLLATGQEPAGTDNLNATRLANLAETTVASLGGRTVGDYYSQFAAGVGEVVADRQNACDSAKYVVQQLQTSQAQVSGVDINEEAAGLMVFERMYQAMAKYMSTLQKTQGYLADAMV